MAMGKLTCDTPIYVLNPEKYYTHIKVKGSLTWGESIYKPRSSGHGGWTVEDKSGEYNYTLNLRFVEPARMQAVNRRVEPIGYKYTDQLRERQVFILPDDVALSYGRMEFSYRREDGADYQEGGYNFDIVNEGFDRTYDLVCTNVQRTFWNRVSMYENGMNMMVTSNYDDQGSLTSMSIGKLGANGVWAIYPSGDRPLDEWHEDFNYMLTMRCTILEAE